jgi:glycosyltransferase involved in cell wall biosynthesis
MAEALATILLDDTMRSEMAEVMRRRVASYYHKDRVTRIYEELYAELMAEPAPLIDLGNHDRNQCHH